MDNIDIKKFRTNILEEIEIRHKQSDTLKLIQESLIKGLKEQSQIQIFEYVQFDEEWIVGLESFFPSLEKITRDIRSTLKYEEEILPVEKTRRTNPESIRHLLRNTRYIKEINEDGSVIPEKVLNALSEIDYGIYENRFIMTLIDRVYTFLAERINIIKDNIHGNRETSYKFRNQFAINNTNFDIDITAKAVEDLEVNDLDVHNHRIYHRLLSSFKNIGSLYNSEFMKMMKRYSKVQPPILKTQIILKNPDFRQAYLMWLYLDRLHELEYTLRKETKEKKIGKEYQNEINQSLFITFLTLFDNTNFGGSIGNDEKYSVKQIKPKTDVNNYVNNLTLDDIPIFEIEPNLASQYYLDQMKKKFEKDHQRIAHKTNNPTLSLKQVLLEQYKIADQVYNYYFEADQDKDVFDQLLRENNPVKKYNEAYDKYIITKMAREVKEKILEDALNLEEEWIDYLKELNFEAMDHATNKILDHHNEILKEEEKEFERKLKNFEEKTIQKYDQNLKQRRKTLEERINTIRHEYDERLEKFKESEKVRLAKAKKEFKDKLKSNQVKIKEKYKEKNNDLSKDISDERSIVIEEEQANYNFEKQKIKSITDDEIDRLKKENK